MIIILLLYLYGTIILHKVKKKTLISLKNVTRTNTVKISWSNLDG